MTSRLQHFRSSLVVAALVSLWISGAARTTGADIGRAT